MKFFTVATLLCLLALAPPTEAAEGEPRQPGCLASSHFHTVWTKVAERNCLKCHNPTGDASDTQFVLQDSTRLPPEQRTAALTANCAVFTRMASLKEEDGNSRLLLKATGGLDHGGGEALKRDSTELRVLTEFVDSIHRKPVPNAADLVLSDDELESFYDGVTMVSDQRLLRRLTLSLAARLPTKSERSEAAQTGLASIEPLLASVMQEDAFYERLLEGFNDVFLTLGYNGNGEDVLSYNHFQHTRHWYQKHSLDHLPEKDRQRARYKLADQYREALRREPLELLRHIVRSDRPFSELLTADYTMVSPYTSRGYGVYEELKDKFQDPESPFEFIPTRLKALTHRDGQVQPTAEGTYPHAGVLSMFQYLRRYPTTETNRNRLRARMYYQHFLGVDIMNLAPRVGDAAAIDAKYEIPTMQAAECVVCHRTIDPIAGLFQDYYNEDGHYGPRKDGWFVDMFGPGREGADLPEADRWRALQWLGERTVTDPRFGVAMAEHVYYIMMGRRVLLPPDDIDDQHFAARRRAYLVQRQLIDRAATRFSQDDFNLKSVFKEIAVSEVYRADGLEAVANTPDRAAELDDVGIVRLLSPEQIERRIVAIFGKPWGRLDDSYAILYGGIDSKEVTERLTAPSGAIGALQRILANDVACKNVAADFSLPAGERRLFPDIEPDVVPATDKPEPEQQIRAAIVHLHSHILGRTDQPDSPEVELTLQLFTGILEDATARGRFEPTENYFCKSAGQEGPRDPDPHYTIRAWRGVVTYLLRQQEFLYE
jgi:hypothetical protein